MLHETMAEKALACHLRSVKASLSQIRRDAERIKEIRPELGKELARMLDEFDLTLTCCAATDDRETT